MKHFLFVIIVLLPFGGVAQCTLGQYQKLLDDAEKAVKRGEYDLAINKLQSAKVCQPRKEGEVNARVLSVFEKVNGERKEAEAERRRIYANDLAFKSQLALDGGDIYTSFRLAEFAYRYVDSENSQVLQSLTNAYYYNDNPNNNKVFWSDAIELQKPDARKQFDLNGHILAIASSEVGYNYRHSEISILDVEKNEYRSNFIIEKALVRKIKISPDGQLLCVGYYGNYAIAYNINSGSIVQRFVTDSALTVNDIAFSPDGSHLSMVCSNSLLQVWDVQSGIKVSQLSAQNKMILSLAFSPDGTRIATASVDGIIKIWDWQSGVCLLTLQKMNVGVRCVAFSGDGTQVIAGYDDNAVRIWDLANANDSILYRHKAPVTIVQVSPDGRFLASSSEDKTTRFWDLNHNTELTTFSSPAFAVSMIGILFDKFKIVTFSDDNNLRIWHYEQNLRVLPGKHLNELEQIAYSFDGKYIASCSDSKTVNVWNIKTGEIVRKFQHNSEVSCLSFSADSKRLATGSIDRLIRVWDIKNEALPKIIPGHSGAIRSLSFSSDGISLASGSNDSTVIIWSLKTFDILKKLSRRGSDINHVTFSPDGKYLAVSYRTSLALVWDFSENTTVDLIGHTGPVWQIAFTPNGKQVATCSSDRSIKIWDVKSGLVITTMKAEGLKAKTSDIRCIAFSADGRLLASGSFENGIDLMNSLHSNGAVSSLVHIWDVNTGKEVLAFTGNTTMVENIAFSKDGNQLYACFSDSTIHTWSVTCAEIIKRWKETYGSSTMPTKQLQQYDLENLLDQKLGNEERLIQTGEFEQIIAFADFYTEKAREGEYLEKIGAYLNRANRLYASALKLHDDPLIRIKYFKLLIDQAAIFRLNNFTSRLEAPETKALKIVLALHQSKDLEECLNYLLDHTNVFTRDEDLADFFDIGIAIAEKNYSISNTVEKRTGLAKYYCQTAFAHLLISDGLKAEHLIRKSLEIDPANIYAHDFLGHALLLQGKIEEAKSEYSKWKDTPHPVAVGYGYRDVFLNLLTILENAKVVVPHIEEIRTLLRENIPTHK